MIKKQITITDVRCPDDNYEISLTQLTGYSIKDIRGLLMREHGAVYFVVSSIEFEDGSRIGVEGEHDFPYLDMYPKYPIPNMDDDTLERLYQEDNPDDD